MNKVGVIPSQEIKSYIEKGYIKSDTDIPEDNIQPASLDLRIAEGDVVRLPGIFLKNSDDIFKYSQELSKESSLEYGTSVNNNGFMLEAGVPYLMKVKESLELPANVCGYANNKSSSGRLNLQVRLICNNSREFDYIPMGYKGPLYLVIVAKSFPIHIVPGETLNQLRFFQESITNARVQKEELKKIHETEGLVYDKDGKKIGWDEIKRTHSSVLLTADLDNDIVAYRFTGVATNGLWFRDRKVDPSGYFEPIKKPKKNGHITLSKDGFYILSSKEAFKVPADYCSEMVAYSTGIGEYRSHFAGFFDPGWGCGKDKSGNVAVLEIIPHEDILLSDGQPACLMDVYKMTEKPDKLYGEAGNNYYHQSGPRLGKQFAPPKPIACILDWE